MPLPTMVDSSALVPVAEAVGEEGSTMVGGAVVPDPAGGALTIGGEDRGGVDRGQECLLGGLWTIGTTAIVSMIRAIVSWTEDGEEVEDGAVSRTEAEEVVAEVGEFLLVATPALPMA